MSDKLFIQIRIYVNTMANGDAVTEAAEALKDNLYDERDDPSSPIHGLVEDVTYEVIREVFPDEEHKFVPSIEARMYCQICGCSETDHHV